MILFEHQYGLIVQSICNFAIYCQISMEVVPFCILTNSVEASPCFFPITLPRESVVKHLSFWQTSARNGILVQFNLYLFTEQS